MLGQLKYLLAGGVLASLPVLSWPDTSPATHIMLADGVQDPTEVPRDEARWNFAVLQYRGLTGKLVEIPARNLAKVWVLTGPDGQVHLELLYQNADYSMARVEEFHLIRRSGSLSAVDVPVQRTLLAGMAFPKIQTK